MPFTMGATLPIAERYTSIKFRRVARWFRPKRLDRDDALELLAFLRVVPVHWSKWVFQWTRLGLKNVAYLETKWGNDPSLDLLVQENFRNLSVEDGLAVLQAMRDGGWVRGKVPWVVKTALRGLRDQGETLAGIARRVGLSYDQVQYICTGRPDRIGNRGRAAAVLAIG